MVAAVTRACNKDDYHETCSCDYKYGNLSKKNYRWSGCNDNIKFGMSFAKEFLDAREFEDDARALMNRQNNLAGRMVSYLRLLCSLCVLLLYAHNICLFINFQFI